MNDHTPGPLTAKHHRYGLYRIICDNRVIADNIGEHGPGTAKGNAALLAAAPDLLAALESLTDWGCTHTSPLDQNSPHELLIAARNAIAKATGEKP